MFCVCITKIYFEIVILRNGTIRGSLDHKIKLHNNILYIYIIDTIVILKSTDSFSLLHFTFSILISRFMPFLSLKITLTCFAYLYCKTSMFNNAHYIQIHQREQTYNKNLFQNNKNNYMKSIQFF